MQDLFTLSSEYKYLIVISAVLLIPKILLRLRIPTGISCLVLGALCINFLRWFKDDQLILVLARLGITSLFLFAGMEIELSSLKENIGPLTKHLVKFLLIILVSSIGIYYFTPLSIQVGMIISVALFTPSAGFILSSLNGYELNDQEVFWIKLKAISEEVAAIIVLFFALQLDDFPGLFQTKLVFCFLIVVLPVIFKYFLKAIAPFAPGSEVSFLVIIALIAGVLTMKLGTHYLVGAFITGVVAGQFNHFMKSKESKRILDSLATFFYIFVPFYFFKAGLLMTGDMLSLEGVIIGSFLALLIIPFRISSVFFSVEYFVEESFDRRMKICVALIPNLIFGLVVVTILKDKFEVHSAILSALVLYTFIASILPVLLFKKIPPEDYDVTRW